LARLRGGIDLVDLVLFLLHMPLRVEATLRSPLGEGVLVEKVLVAMEVFPNLLQEGMYLGQRTRRLRLRKRGERR
jgi:hypothetical protein